MGKNKGSVEDISKEIERTREETPVIKEIVNREEQIAKAVEKTPYVPDELEVRKKKFINFAKQKKDWIIYIILAFILFIGLYIRTLNIPKLKDVTTGTWTLGPDLDPFLFLRWAEYIAEHGKLMVHDTLRYVPLEYDTAGEMKLLSYMIAWFHKFLATLGLSDSVTFSAIIFPVVMFGLTAVAFFIFAKKIFYKENKITKNIIALIATAFFVLIPSLLPRTIAGIPEKESAAFFFMFLAFYFFLEAFTSEKLKNGVILGILAGIMTGIMALIWGGVMFVFLTIAPTIFLTFLLGKIKWKELGISTIWIISSVMTMIPFSTRYGIEVFIPSISHVGLVSGVIILISVSLLLMGNQKIMSFRKRTKLPRELFSMIISILVFFLIVLIVLRPGFILSQINALKSNLIEPQVSRFGFTVAENKQPYFLNDWKDSFGPIIFNLPLFFWLFFTGAVVLFGSLIKELKKKEKIILIFSYFIFLISLIFSRYSAGGILNGTNGLSLLVYFGGGIIFFGSFGYLYYKKYNEGSFSDFGEFNFAYILYFLILTLGIIGARGGIRLIMVLGAISPIAISFLIVKTSQKYFKTKEEFMKLSIGIILIIIMLASLFTLWNYYKQDKYTSENFAPTVYTQQWQKAMSWVRENTSEDAVFAHWWDYGYWVQSIGKRATILDGGNAIVYWDYLMGRYVLTGTDEGKALEFLYAHNGTHLLIDSTDIGKYTAFSSIGSDENYDRFSWISTFLMDEGQTQETKDEKIYVYVGGTILDEDIVWEGKLLPGKNAGVGALVLKENSQGKIMQPEVIIVYGGQQTNIPLRYAYIDGKLIDYEKGLDAGIFVFPSLNVLSDGSTKINQKGAAMFLSGRTVHSQLAQLYLFNQYSDYIKLVHTEDNFIIENLKQQGYDPGDFIYYQGLQGPIKIWEISYPSNITLNPEFLEKDYPNESLNIAKSGEY